MKEFWTPESVQWYCDAAAYSGYFQHLADHLEHYLNPGESILDLGCGPGLLVDELNLRGYRASGIDCCEAAMEHWSCRCDRHGRCFCGETADLFSIPPRQLATDVVMATHFGRDLDDFLYMLQIPAQRYIFVKNVRTSESSRGKHRTTGFELQAFLDVQEIPYRKETVTLDFSQPLPDRESIERFRACYGFPELSFRTMSGPVPYLVEKKKEMMILCAEPHREEKEKKDESMENL